MKYFPVILILPLLLACEKEEQPEDNPSEEAYFIEARVDGTPWRLEGDNSTNCLSEVGVCFTTKAEGENQVTLRINKPLTAGITLNELQSLQGDTLSFKMEKDIYALVEWDFDGAIFNTESSIIQAESYLYLQDVEVSDTISGFGASALLRGVFSCNLKSKNGQATKSVRQGQFYLRVFESN